MTRACADWSLAARLAAEGQTSGQISRALGIGRTAVLWWAKCNDIELGRHVYEAKPRINRGDVTQAMLAETYAYDPETGCLTHRKSKNALALAGGVAGTISKGPGGYVRREIVFRGIRIGAGRLIWMLVHGKWPQGHIDHINGNALDNRLSNLRDVSAAVNMQNQRRATSNSKTGLLGVSKHHDGARPYTARITPPDGGKPVRLGYFATPEEAHAAYVEAKRRLHVGCTI